MTPVNVRKTNALRFKTNALRFTRNALSSIRTESNANDDTKTKAIKDTVFRGAKSRGECIITCILAAAFIKNTLQSRGSRMKH